MGGLLPLDRLLTDTDARSRFVGWVRQHWMAKGENVADPERAIKAFDELMEFLSNTCPLTERFSGNTEQRADLRTLTSVLVSRYIGGVRLSGSASGRRALVEQRFADEMKMLKQLIWYYIIENPALASQQHGQRRVISELFRTFLDAATGSNGVHRAILPVATLEELDKASQHSKPQLRHEERIRSVVDLIAGMTEDQALRWYGRLMGHSAGSVRDALTS